MRRNLKQSHRSLQYNVNNLGAKFCPLVTGTSGGFLLNLIPSLSHDTRLNVYDHYTLNFIYRYRYVLYCTTAYLWKIMYRGKSLFEKAMMCLSCLSLSFGLHSFANQWRKSSIFTWIENTCTQLTNRSHPRVTFKQASLTLIETPFRPHQWCKVHLIHSCVIKMFQNCIDQRICFPQRYRFLFWNSTVFQPLLLQKMHMLYNKYPRTCSNCTMYIIITKCCRSV